MKKIIHYIPSPKRELVQLGLVLIILLVMTEDFIEVFEPTINIIEASVFMIAVALAIELYRLKLSRYTIFYTFVGFCYNPISLNGFNDYTRFRPNWFIAFVSLFLLIILQHYSSLKKDEEGNHVGTQSPH